MITSTSNPQVKQIVNLQNKAKLRNELELYVVEGTKMVEELPEECCYKVFASESYAKNEKNQEILKKFSAEITPDIVAEYAGKAGNQDEYGIQHNCFFAIPSKIVNAVCQ